MYFQQRPDHYPSMQELLRAEKEGIDYEVTTLSRFRDDRYLVVAPHGGDIEFLCSELAYDIAGEEFQLFDFRGIKNGDNHTLHVTSSKYNDPTFMALSGTVHTIVSIHGFRDDREMILLGGRDENMRQTLFHSLESNGYPVEIARPPLAGIHPRNLCNGGLSRKGLQIEISEPLRIRFSQSKEERNNFTTLVRDHLFEWQHTTNNE